MPQMAPYNWLLLNIMFTLILITISTLMYYNTPSMNTPAYSLQSFPQSKFFIKW